MEGLKHDRGSTTRDLSNFVLCAVFCTYKKLLFCFDLLLGNYGGIACRGAVYVRGPYAALGYDCTREQFLTQNVRKLIQV